MIKKYSELKGVIKVGDRVRAVEGKHNPCSELASDDSSEATIEAVSDEYFSINTCTHYYSEAAYLDIISHIPTWETLQVGDVIVDKDGSESTALAVLGEVFLKSMWNAPKVAHVWFHINEAQKNGWILKVPVTEIEEVTMAQIIEKFGHEVKIKKD